MSLLRLINLIRQCLQNHPVMGSCTDADSIIQHEMMESAQGSQVKQVEFVNDQYRDLSANTGWPLS